MSNLRDGLNGHGLYLLSQIVRKTGRYQVAGLHHLKEAQASGQPFIGVAWHGMTMMLVGFFQDHYDLSSLVLLLPDDWRGGALSVFTRKLGAQPFPMDLSGDGGMTTARRLASLVRRVRQGSDCYITPDGPDGPAYIVKPGVAYIAKKADAIILPLGAYARHGYRVNRWDQYTLPYPFSRISVNVGAPIPAAKDQDDLTAVTGTLTNILHRVTAQAAANYYEWKS
jgi:lysophospholipid acyltransferase (LPLAT)-like uncharacterized protein